MKKFDDFLMEYRRDREADQRIQNDRHLEVCNRLTKLETQNKYHDEVTAELKADVKQLKENSISLTGIVVKGVKLLIATFK